MIYSDDPPSQPQYFVRAPLSKMLLLIPSTGSGRSMLIANPSIRSATPHQARDIAQDRAMSPPAAIVLLGDFSDPHKIDQFS